MKHLLWMLGDKLFATFFTGVFVMSSMWATWLATGSLVAVLGVLFITVLYSVTLVSWTIRIGMDQARDDLMNVWKLGYIRGMKDLVDDVSKQEKRDEDA